MGKSEKGRRKMRNVGKKDGKKQKLMTVFFFCFSLLQNDWNFFKVYQNGSFDRENPKITPGKNRDKWLYPPWKIFLSCPCILHTQQDSHFMCSHCVYGHLWRDQAKWVWSRKFMFSVFWDFLLGHVLSFNLVQTP